MKLSRSIPLSVCLMCALLALGACGQKGPLYLPEDDPEPVEEPAPADETTSEEDDNDDEENGR